MSKKRKADRDEWKPPPSFAWNSAEAKAIKSLHEVVDRTSAFFAVWRSKEDGSVSFSREMTPQLLKFAEVGDHSTWATLTYQQAVAWEEFFDTVFPKAVLRKHMREGSKAPWLWPPSLEGKLYPDGPGPTAKDLDALASEGKK